MDSFSKETKIYILFIVLFSFLFLLSGTFDDIISEDGKDGIYVDVDRQDIQIQRDISIPITNTKNENTSTKMSFNVDLYRTANMTVDCSSREYTVELERSQEYITRSCELKPGTNWINISHDGGLSDINNIEIYPLDRSLFFSSNWKVKGVDKTSYGSSEIHYISSELSKKAKMDFKYRSKGKTEIDVYLNGKRIETVKAGSDFKFYQTPYISLKQGENIIRMVSDEEFSIRDLSVDEDSENRGFELGKNWYPEENWYHDETRRFFNFNWMEQNATLSLYNEKNNSLQEDVFFKLSSFQEGRNLTVYLNGKRVKTEEVKLTVDEGREEIVLENLTLSQGNNVLKLVTKPGCKIHSKLSKNSSDDRCLSLALYGTGKIENNLSFFRDINRKIMESGMYYYSFISVPIIILFLVLFAIFRQNFLDSIYNKRFLVLLIVFIVVVSVGLRLMQPGSFQLFLDEPLNTEAGRMFHETKSPSICTLQTSGEECHIFEKVSGYPLFLALIFVFTGFSINSILSTSILLSSLTPPLIFLLIYLIDNRNMKSAFLTSAAFAILPVHLSWSHTAESYVTSFFFIILSFVLLYWHIEKKDIIVFTSSLLSLLFTLTLRPENILLILPFFGILVMERKDKLLNIKHLIPISFFFVGLSLHSINFLSSLGYYFDVTTILPGSRLGTLPPFIPPAMLFLGIIGIIVSFKVNKNLTKFMTLWLFFAIPGIFFETGTQRLLIPLYFFLILSASKVVLHLIEKLKFMEDREKIFLTLSAIVLLCVPIIVTPSYTNLDGKILQTKVSKNASSSVPDNCYIVAQSPELLPGAGKEIIETEYALDNQRFVRNLVNKSCVLYFEGMGCEKDIERLGWERNCNRIKESFQMDEYSSYERNDIQFRFFKLRDTS